MSRFMNSALLTAVVFFSMMPLAHAQTPLDLCIDQAEVNIAALEYHVINDGVDAYIVHCTRMSKGGFYMDIYTDCGLGDPNIGRNNIYIWVNKADGWCRASHQKFGICPDVPGAGTYTGDLSNKDLAAMKKTYRNRCADWEPPSTP